MSETKATIKQARLIQIAPLGTHAQIEIPGAGRKWIHQSGVHDDSEVYWDSPKKAEKGPGTLVLHGWYAKKIGIEED